MKRYKFIAISFTLKGQSFSAIKTRLQLIQQDVVNAGKVPILVHGFMPRHVVIEKGFSTEVSEALDELFPLQVNCFTQGVPMRGEMPKLLNAYDGDLYVIGEIKEGVADEVAEYKKVDIDIKQHYPL